jgi:Tol biopolymer transport system component
MWTTAQSSGLLRGIGRFAALLIATLALVVSGMPARATYPGHNGRLAFTRLRSDFTGPRDVWLKWKGAYERVTNGYTVGQISWSPDGNQIAFAATGPTTDSEIYVYSDGLITNLTNNPAEDLDPDWSPDGTKLLFISDRDGPVGDLYTMEADGSSLTKILESSLYRLYFIGESKWSPDGSRIALDCYFEAYTDLCLVNADGSELEVLLGRATSGDWSPDGTEIVYFDGLNFQIWIINPDTHQGRRLVSGSCCDDIPGSPAFSPDGRKVVYAEYGDIWAVNSVDGSGLWHVTGASSSYELRPAWQPLP